MKKNKKIPDNQITVYETAEGRVNIEVLYSDENIWLSQKQMAELFDCSKDNISLHLKNIYADGELDEKSTVEDFSVVQKEGSREIKRKLKFYSLEAIIAVGYRVNSDRGTQFRQWAINILKNYIHKGFALDGDRFKYGSRFSTRFFDDLLEEIRDIRSSERMIYQKITDIYATSMDYTPKAEVTKNFFATVQNKLHFAITGQTAVRNKPMYMKDWVERLNAFLKFSEYEILNNSGKISHEVALKLAEKEYDEFRKVQDKDYISDFDNFLDMVEERKAKYGKGK